MRWFAAYQRALEIEPAPHSSTTPLDTARDMYRRAITEAERVLSDPDATPEDKARATQTRIDARANLAKLGR